MNVEGRVMMNDASLALRAAIDGPGLAIALEAMAPRFLRVGAYAIAGGGNSVAWQILFGPI